MAESSNKESLISSGKRHILYDASLIEHPRAELFDIDSAQQAADEHSLAEGRGQAVFFKHEGIDLVLKHYQRGGKMAALLGDRYIGLNCGKSRSFKEWRLLKYMHELNLPVPVPVAACCTRAGLFYRADLVMRQIHNVVTLADHLMHEKCDQAGWQSIGACIRRFHDASICHADLNARNILLNAGSGDVYLIDFDKGAMRYLGDAWKASNLARLQRSLLKFKSLNQVFHFEQHDWNALLDGYKNSG